MLYEVITKTIFKIDKIQKEEYPFLIAIAAALFLELYMLKIISIFSLGMALPELDTNSFRNNFV